MSNATETPKTSLKGKNFTSANLSARLKESNVRRKGTTTVKRGGADGSQHQFVSKVVADDVSDASSVANAFKSSISDVKHTATDINKMSKTTEELDGNIVGEIVEEIMTVEE